MFVLEVFNELVDWRVPEFCVAHTKIDRTRSLPFLFISLLSVFLAVVLRLEFLLKLGMM